MDMFTSYGHIKKPKKKKITDLFYAFEPGHVPLMCPCKKTVVRFKVEQMYLRYIVLNNCSPTIVFVCVELFSSTTKQTKL